MDRIKAERNYYNAQCRLLEYEQKNRENFHVNSDGSLRIPRKYENLFYKVEEAEQAAKNAGLTEDEIEKISEQAHYDSYVRWGNRKPSLMMRWKRIELVLHAGIVLVFFALIMMVGGHLIQYPIGKLTLLDHIKQGFLDFYANISSELIGIIITVFIIDRLNQRRDDEQQRKRLIRQLRNSDLNFAMIAFSELVEEGHLRNGSLEGARLNSIKLPGAYFHSTKLQRVDFSNSNLEKTYWGGADLQHANFYNVNLNGAQMYGANLMGASFISADLRGAKLTDANLLWATFREEINSIDPKTKQPYVAVLEAKFDINTILPDGSPWSEETNLDYFTDFFYPGGYWKPKTSPQDKMVD